MPRKQNEIPYPLAYRISDKYHCVPNTRDGQEALILMRGYSKLRGTPLKQCSANQIYTVAQKILNQSYQKARGMSYTEAVLVPECRTAYHNQLYEMFNVPMNDEDPNFVPPSELEQMLLD